MENKLQILTVANVRGYEKDGTVFLNVEDVARGLGFVESNKFSTSGENYIRWERINGYLKEFGFANKVAKDTYIPENIFYRLAMKAKNEVAEKFQILVADEILPAIRKHGAYMTPATIEEIANNPDLLIQLGKNLKLEREKRIAAEKTIEQQKPKVLFADAVETSNTSILIGELAKLLKQNGVDIGQNRLFDWLRDNGYLIKAKRSDWNMPTQSAMDMKLFEVKESTHNNPDGSVRICRTTKVTGKGQTYFVNKFLNQKAVA